MSEHGISAEPNKPQGGFGLQPRVGAASRFAATTLGTQSAYDPSTPNGVASDVVRSNVTRANQTHDATPTGLFSSSGGCPRVGPINRANPGLEAATPFGVIETSSPIF